MKWILLGAVAVALAMLSLSLPTDKFSSHAYAGKMNGKGNGCSDRICAGINSPHYNPAQWGINSQKSNSAQSKTKGSSH
jgi:hypothetical protein